LAKFSDTKEKWLKKAEDSIEKNKLRAALMELEEEQKEAFLSLGREVYRAVSEDGIAESAQFVNRINALAQKKESLEKKIALLSGRYICPNCRKEQSAEHLYCSACGTPKITT